MRPVTVQAIKYEIKARWRAARNCLLGRPTAFRLSLVQPPAPPALNLGRDNPGALIADCRTHAS